jgi:hypothetical protein
LPPDVLATVAAAARARDIPISVYDRVTAFGDPDRRDPSPLRSIAPSPSVVLADEKLFMPEMRPGDLWFGAIKIGDAGADCSRRRGVEVYDADELPTLLGRLDACSLGDRCLPPFLVRQEVNVAVEMFRAHVESIGGKRPSIRLRSFSDNVTYTLRLSKQLAQQTSPYLYQDVDVEARVTRLMKGPDFPVIYGNVVDITPIPSTDPVEAWDEWYEKSGRPWDRIDDVDGELGRNGA